MENENENEDINRDVIKDVVKEKKTKREKFTIPTIEEVKTFAESEMIGSIELPEKFHNYYESNGWLIGKVSMKNWKAAVSNWIKNLDRYGNNKQGTGQGIGKNDYKSAAAQYDFEKYGDTPVGQIFGIGRSR